MAGGPKSATPSDNALPEPEEAWVASVNIVVAALAPGVTVVGENVAVHLLGSPTQENETEESNEPNWGVS